MITFTLTLSFAMLLDRGTVICKSTMQANWMTENCLWKIDIRRTKPTIRVCIYWIETWETLQLCRRIPQLIIIFSQRAPHAALYYTVGGIYNTIMKVNKLPSGKKYMYMETSFTFNEYLLPNHALKSYVRFLAGVRRFFFGTWIFRIGITYIIWNEQ